MKTTEITTFSIGAVVTLNSGSPPMTVCMQRVDQVQVVYVCHPRQIIRKEWVDHRCLRLYKIDTDQQVKHDD